MLYEVITCLTEAVDVDVEWGEEVFEPAVFGLDGAW